MKKRIRAILLATAILSSLVISAAAAQARTIGAVPVLTFNGRTANCSVSITSLGKPITATLELWCSDTLVDSWSDSATSRLIIDESCIVTPGQTYTLKTSGTIDGVPFTGTPVTGTCPK